MIGIFSKTTDSNFIEAAGLSGLDFIIIDQEHGHVGKDRLHDHLRAAKEAGVKAIVRVKELNHNDIGSALDAGADGVQVPNISTVKEAKLAINAARFYPLGERGVCRFVKAAAFGSLDKQEYFETSNEKLLILQVEGTLGISNIDKILDLEGYDILFVGPYDLSQSLGIPGKIQDKRILDTIDQLIEKAKSKNKKFGVFCDDISYARRLKQTGVDYLAYSVDLNIFLNACTNLINEIKK
ncbi:MAG: hypothetical protein JJ958_14915 [Balneola sp.]|nr:hypothetical protein [Balneola sp.]